MVRRLGQNKVRDTEFFQDMSTGRMFVIKTIRIKSQLSEEQKRLIMTVNLQAIIRPLRDTEIDTSNEKRVRIALPYFATGSLEDVIRNTAIGKVSKKWNATKKSVVAFGLAVGLKFLHSKEVVCGFMNPRNVLLTTEYEPKITDYWYLMCVDPAEYVKEAGNDVYLAPEVREGKINRLSDIYSYGMILLAMLSGCTQFEKGVDLASYLPSVLAGNICDLIARCWSPVLSSRPSLSDFIDLFQKDIEIFPGTDSVAFGEYRAKLLREMEQKESLDLPEMFPLGEIIDDKAVDEAYKTEVEKQNKYAILLSAIHRREGKGCTVNKKIALKHFKSAAEKGIPEAQAVYGVLNGVRTKGAQGRNEMALWTKAAADGGNSEAQLRYALMVVNGQAVGNSETVKKYMSLAIEQDSVDAAVAYADLLTNGTLVPQNSKDAEKYLNIAADFGHADSQLALAKLLLDEGSENYEEIAHYLRAAFANGNVDAAIPLSHLFADDHVVPVSARELSKVLRTAADKADPKAQQKYATLVITKAIPSTSEELVRCYKIVADNNDIDAMRTYAEMLRKGEGVQRNMAAAASYYQKAADLGDVISQYEYGYYLFDRMERERGTGIGLPLSYLKKAADAGYAPAQYQCGILLRQYGTSQDQPLACNYFDQAAKQGDMDAKICKANMMIDGIGCDLDIAGGTALMKEAADQGSAQAAQEYANLIRGRNPGEALRYFEAEGALPSSIFEAARMYDEGEGTECDLVKAFELFQKAADMGYVPAIYEVGRRLKLGLGVTADSVKAFEAIRKAADEKHKEAMYDYADMLEEGVGCTKNVSLARYFRDMANRESDYEEEDDIDPSFEFYRYSVF